MGGDTRHRPPGPERIRTWEDARRAAARWMRYWEFEDAVVTMAGPDSGIDVAAAGSLAQVRIRATPVGQPALQRLVDAGRSRPGKALLFFTAATYTTEASAYAERAGVALFGFDLTGGRMTPQSTAANALVERVGERDAHAAVRGWTPAPPATGTQIEIFSNPGTAGCLTAVAFVAATCLLVGVDAVISRTGGVTAAILVLGVLGTVAYVFGLWSLLMGVIMSRKDRRRLAPATAVVLGSAPGVALWTLIAHFIDKDLAGAPVGAITAALMVAPLLILLWAAARPVRPAVVGAGRRRSAARPRVLPPSFWRDLGRRWSPHRARTSSFPE